MRDSRFLVSLVLLVVVVLLNLPMQVSVRLKNGAQDNIAPFQNGLTLIVRNFLQSISSFAGARELAAEKVQMTEEIANLKHEIKQLKNLQDENDKLRREVGFQKQSKYGLVLCEVVARGDTSGWWKTITINKGKADGIEPNRAVVTTAGLVGTTIRVADSTADILLVVDYNCKVSCKVERTGSIGVLRGAGVSMWGDERLEMLWAVRSAEMQYISKDQQIQEGDKVVTSGLGGIYPEGLLVGFVKKITLHSSGLYYSAEVDLSEDLDALEHVFVVKSKAGVNRK